MDVSIILPVHNNEHTIKRTMESVLNQITNHDELIVVINGSTDRSEEIVMCYAGDPRVRIQHSSTGRSRARNKGLLSAKGRFINFLDADDTMTPQHIVRAKQFLIANVDYDAYTDETMIVNKNEKHISIQYTHETNTHCLKYNNIFEIGAVMFRNKSIVMFIDELEYNEDYVFWIENLMNRKVYFNRNFVGVHKFIDGNNTMIKYKKEMIATQIIVSAILKKKNMRTNSLGTIELLKKELKFLLVESSKNEKLFEIVNKQYSHTMTLARMILKIPVINKIVIRHYL
ncbi:glycosyltransferase family 2 protein [Leuconostoc suionicum]|uniref:glycosyltransferase family 2 protein n=1 Tax=Leuconostoc suionicum TaxID=1511761 RepID=UPI00233F4A87|nr:glycosyltransferase family 2 protein [Leuconostoc suionicum]MDC2816373.1 glycosyltransferase family 2 protein [Leuconostoc suionicum]